MNIKPLQIRTWSQLGMEKSLYGIAMPEVLEKKPDTYVVTADLCGYSGMDRIARMYPDKIVNVGIQEQNMLGVAAGLALEGNTVFVGSYAAFSVARAMEQVRHNLSVLQLDIKVVGYNAGYAKNVLGKSHWATEDVAFMRSLPNLTVVSPADSLEAVKACLALAARPGPAYIRLTSEGACPMVQKADYPFEIGKGILLKEGRDTAILATGLMVAEALRAAEQLEAEGISAAVYNIHTIKPLDNELIDALTQQYEHLFTAEEHNVIGGLGSAVAERMSSARHSAVLHRIGMQDCVYKIGSREFIWRQAGMTAEQMKTEILKKLK